MPPPKARGRGGQTCVLEGSLKPTHKPAFASGPCALQQMVNAPPPTCRGRCRPARSGCVGRAHMEPLFYLHNENILPFFFFFKSAMHILQPRSIHNKLMAWGILHERFYICSVHRSSRFLCLSQSGKLPEQQTTQIKS